jgi:hypothetical protein
MDWIEINRALSPIIDYIENSYRIARIVPAVVQES